MKVLVAVASKHGATLGIGEAIAGTLRHAGLEVDVTPVEGVTSLEEVGAVVLGSGVYAGHWMKSALAFVDRFEGELRARPVWLFSSGPLGDPPQPEQEPAETEPLVARLGAREHRLFAGQLDKSELGLAERAAVALVRAPEGDYRMWPEIAAWGAQIAAALSSDPGGAG